MNDTNQKNTFGSDNGVSRRYFLRVAGTVTLGIGVGGYAGVKEALPKIVKLADGRSGLPVSGGYLLVDLLAGQRTHLFENLPQALAAGLLALQRGAQHPTRSSRTRLAACS